MRISISGCGNSGKSTLIESFSRRWPMYVSPSSTYRDLIKSSKITHSSSMNDESQLMILDSMMKEQEKFTKEDNVIFDRCSWDCLAYTLQGNENEKVSDTVTAAIISLVRESLKNIDIIFWLEYNPNLKIKNNGVRETDESFITKTDKIFSDLFENYMDNLEQDIFYPKDDAPAIIKMGPEFATVDDRIGFISEFIDRNGNLIETETSILDPQNLDILEQMMKDQEGQKISEDQLKEVMKKLKF